MSASEPVDFIHEPDPANPGWWTWELPDPSRYNSHALGPLLVRQESERTARVRLQTERHHSNILGAIHGGVVLGLADVAIYAAARLVLGEGVIGSVTLELGNQFMGSGQVGEPLDAVVEVLHETGRMVFLRGVMQQGERLIGSFTATLRKAGKR